MTSPPRRLGPAAGGVRLGLVGLGVLVVAAPAWSRRCAPRTAGRRQVALWRAGHRRLRHRPAGRRRLGIYIRHPMTDRDPRQHVPPDPQRPRHCSGRASTTRPSTRLFSLEASSPTSASATSARCRLDRLDRPAAYEGKRIALVFSGRERRVRARDRRRARPLRRRDQRPADRAPPRALEELATRRIAPWRSTLARHRRRARDRLPAGDRGRPRPGDARAAPPRRRRHRGRRPDGAARPDVGLAGRARFPGPVRCGPTLRTP